MSQRTPLINYLVLIGFSAATVIPFLGLLLLALQPAGGSISTLSLSHLTLDNFARAWAIGRFDKGILSSVTVATAVVVISALLSILTGYAFGTMSFLGDRALFNVFLLGLIVPFEAAVLPLYYTLRSVGLTDTYWALILPQAGSAMAFGTFWMRAAFKSFPFTLIEAARLDGATSFSVLWRVIVPNIRPAIFTLVILQFMWTWNEFLLALIMISNPDLQTVPLGLAAFVGQHTTDLPGLAAASLIVALPIIALFVIFQRQFIAGMLAGALR